MVLLWHCYANPLLEPLFLRVKEWIIWNLKMNEQCLYKTHALYFSWDVSFKHTLYPEANISAKNRRYVFECLHMDWKAHILTPVPKHFIRRLKQFSGNNWRHTWSHFKGPWWSASRGFVSFIHTICPILRQCKGTDDCISCNGFA